MIIAELIEELNRIAPPSLAEDGDSIGLQAGGVAQELRHVCVCVDPVRSAVEDALRAKADLLVSHHPLIRDPLKSLAAGDPVADVALRIVRAGMGLFVMHTNYDIADGGVNDVLAETLGLRETTPLTCRRQERFCKVVVFVPAEAVDRVRDSMAAAGAGVIGNYTHCSFHSPGIGTFEPQAEANPYRGSRGRLEEVEEFRLEMLCTESRLGGVLAAMRSSHPYEEVAFDVYQLANDPVTRGFGRVGSIDGEIAAAELAEFVQERLQARYVRVLGDPHRQVSRVAVMGGGGSSFCRDAAAAGAHAFVTGDVKHHDALRADALGVTVIDAGHFETERPGMQALAERLRVLLKEHGVKVSLIQ